jgi:hypothetical protein
MRVGIVDDAVLMDEEAYHKYGGPFGYQPTRAKDPYWATRVAVFSNGQIPLRLRERRHPFDKHNYSEELIRLLEVPPLDTMTLIERDWYDRETPQG